MESGITVKILLWEHINTEYIKSNINYKIDHFYFVWNWNWKDFDPNLRGWDLWVFSLPCQGGSQRLILDLWD
jgi:hypothetical protein